MLDRGWIIIFLLATLPFACTDKSAEDDSHGDPVLPKNIDSDSGGLLKMDGRGLEATKNTSNGSGTIASTTFLQGFISSISVILVSEIGDKTFFIAAIMAMRHARLVVFAGAIMALIIMTVLSAVLGYATTVIPKVYTHYLSIFLFIFFGLRMLREAYYMSDEDGMEEFEEVQKSLNRREAENSQSLAESGGATPHASNAWERLKLLLSHVFWQSLTLTFIAEWGDRSQLATIILAAKENVYGVTIGAILGHTICTSLAVIAGRLIAQKISVRTVTLIGGIVFLIFAVTSVVMGVGEEKVNV